MKIILISMASFTTLLNTACSPFIVATTIAGAGTTVAADRRDMETIIKDQRLEMKITDTIYRDETLGKQVHVAVTVYNSLVLLTGEVPSATLRSQTEAKLATIKSIRKIFNEIQIAPRISFNKQSQDTWLTTKVKARIIANNAINSHPKVVSSNGVVYLMGLVTANEAATLTDITAKTAGIARVVTLFEEGTEALANNPPMTPPIAMQQSPPTPSIMPTPTPIPLAQQPLWTTEEQDDDITLIPQFPDAGSQLTSEQ